MHHSAILPNPTPLKRTQLHVDLLEGAGLWKCLPGPELSAVAEMAQGLLGSDISAFSVLDRDWQWLTAKCGIDGDKIPREHSFCRRVVDANEPLVVSDTRADPVHRNNPLVTGPPYVGAYAGVPVVTRNENGADIVVGSVCAVFHAPHAFGADDVASLQRLATIAGAIVSSRLAALDLAELANERRDDLHRLARLHRQLEQAERMAGIGSWRLDLADNSIQWSNQIYAIHDLALGDTPPLETAMAFYPGPSRVRLEAAVAAAIEQGRPFDEEIDFTSALGVPKRVRSMGEVELQNDRPVAVIGVFQDVSRRYEMEQTLRRLADTDELTGLVNRGGFNRALTADMAAARREGTELALLLIDLDGFKAVNDHCGHLKGDQVLQTIAGVLHAPYLADCVCARLGGDEFAVMASGLDDGEVSSLATALLADLRHDVELVDGGVLRVSGTIGISRLESGVTERDLLHRADAALYHGKHTERGTAVPYSKAYRTEMCRS